MLLTFDNTRLSFTVSVFNKETIIKTTNCQCLLLNFFTVLWLVLYILSTNIFNIY